MEIHDKAAARGVGVFGSTHPGSAPRHHEEGYEQGAMGHNPLVPSAPLELPDDQRKSPWPNGRGRQTLTDRTDDILKARIG
jgi:hypothetical protein